MKTWKSEIYVTYDELKRSRNGYRFCFIFLSLANITGLVIWRLL